jgi:hypothetical protein
MKQEHVKVAKALGVFSVALGLTQLLAPRWLGQTIGVGGRGRLMRALGLRELAAGVAVLSRPQRSAPLWARTAGDVMDLALLGRAMSGSAKRGRVATALAMVLGVGVMDCCYARRLA